MAPYLRCMMIKDLKKLHRILRKSKNFGVIKGSKFFMEDFYYKS